jgi:hypothetical protein
VAHLASHLGDDESLFTELSGVMFHLQLHLHGLQSMAEVINLGIEGVVLVDLGNEVSLIQIVNSSIEDGVAGLGPPKHVSEPGGKGLEGLIASVVGVGASVKVDSVRGI